MKDNQVYLKVKDHSVSGEEFNLVYDESLDFLTTTPQPSKEDLPGYYQSEDYISHTDAKRNWFEKLYHIIKSIALKRKLKLINGFADQDLTLLDVGCGTGDFLSIAQKNGWKVNGIEPNLKARKIANKKTNDSVFNIEHLLQFQLEQFKVITLWHVLEHLPQLDDHFEIFNRLLKSDGTLVIAVPNFKSYDANYYKSFWAAYDVPRHLWHFSKTSIERIASKHNLKLVQTYPMIFDAYYVSLLSEKYKIGRLNPFKAFWIGWRSNRSAKRTNEYSSLIYVLQKR